MMKGTLQGGYKMKKIVYSHFIILLVLLAWTSGAFATDKNADPQIPIQTEWTIWDDGECDEGINWEYVLMGEYDGFGKLLNENQGSPGPYTLCEEIHTFEMCHPDEPSPPITGYFEEWVLCADDMGYPSDFFNGYPWFRETYDTSTNYPGEWKSYTVDQSIPIALNDDFWLIVLPSGEETPNGHKPVYYGYDTDNWYGSSFCWLSGYYEFGTTIGPFGEGELMFRVWGEDNCSALKSTSLGKIKSIFE
jgi:hypothetical protein